MAQVDDVAFNQEDLEDILREEKIPSTIYLCGENFIFPSGFLRKKNIKYIGVNQGVKILIDTLKSVDLAALKISFENISVTNGESKSESTVPMPEPKPKKTRTPKKKTEPTVISSGGGPTAGQQL